MSSYKQDPNNKFKQVAKSNFSLELSSKAIVPTAEVAYKRPSYVIINNTDTKDSKLS